MKPDEKPKPPPASTSLPKPKRGAFPTPREEIEKAPQFVPGAVQPSGPPEVNPAPPAKADDKKSD